VIRVNSQSGKGGVAYLLEQEYGLELPRRLQIEFSRTVQNVTDETGKESSAADLYRLFEQEYFAPEQPYTYLAHRMSGGGKADVARVEIDLLDNGRPVTLRGSGNGPIDAFTHALGLDIRLMDFHEHAIGSGANAQAASYIELRLNNGPTRFGAGIDANIVTASFKAIVSGLNRQIALGERSGEVQRRDLAA